MDEQGQEALILKDSSMGKLALVLLLVGLPFVAILGMASPAQTGFTQAAADLRYCSRDSTILCPPACNTSSVIITNLNDNCNSFYNANGGYCPDNVISGIVQENQCSASFIIGSSTLYLQKTTKTAFTSATFTNIVSGNGWLIPSGITNNANLVQVIECSATFDFDTSVGTTIGLFRIRDTTNSVNSGYTMQLGPGLVLNTNETIAMLAQFSGYTAGSAPTFAFQVSVTGAAGTITMGPGAMLCTRTSGDAGAAVVG